MHKHIIFASSQKIDLPESDVLISKNKQTKKPTKTKQQKQGRDARKTYCITLFFFSCFVVTDKNLLSELTC